MISYEGKLYIVANTALQGALLGYYDLSFKDKRKEYNWVSLYEKIMSWLIEEFEFPGELESLSKEKQMYLTDQGENITSDAFLLFDENHISDADLNRWVEFCLWIRLVLEKFEHISKLNALKDTPYQKRFRTCRYLILKMKLKLRWIYRDAQDHLSEEALQALSNSAKLLADKWYNLVLKWVISI